MSSDKIRRSCPYTMNEVTDSPYTARLNYLENLEKTRKEATEILSREIAELCEFYFKKQYDCHVEFSRFDDYNHNWVQCDSVLYCNTTSHRLVYYDGELDTIELDIATLFIGKNITELVGFMDWQIRGSIYEYENGIEYNDGKYRRKNEYYFDRDSLYFMEDHDHGSEYYRVEYEDIPEKEKPLIKSAASTV